MAARISWWTAAAVVAAVLFWPARAMAGEAVLVLEVHERTRPADARRLLGPAVRELAAAGLLSGARAARRIEERVSRPTARRERPVAGELLALAASHLRGGREAAAERAMSELVLRFPGAEPSRREHGRDAVVLYREVQEEVARAGAGRLVIEVSDPSAVLFVDEVFRGVGHAGLTVAAGRHQVHARLGRQDGRTRDVVVRAGQVTRVRLALEQDLALRTGVDWAGLIVEPGQPIDAAALRAAAIARAAGAGKAILLAIDRRGSLQGAVVDATSGRVVHRASARIEPGGPGSEELARVLLARPVGESAPSERRWPKWVLASASLVAIGTGAALIHVDGRCQEPVRGRLCSSTLNTAPLGWTAIATGVALAGTSAYYFWRDRPERGVQVGLVPGGSVIGVAIGGRF
ncbi:MAG TPA: hypothetical protein VNO33_08610 [Kofleriaceae bacterium]|nr:hypothetical protein [Kofleriaceae bacterium]